MVRRATFLTITLFWTGVVATPAPAQDEALQRKINIAIDRGVDYLKEYPWGQLKDPKVEEVGTVVGAIALGGWTLLESGVDPKDRTVQRMADHVRQSSPTLTFNYSISLAIFFLDKLNDPGDVPLIEALATRLLASQNRYYGWSYHSPLPNQAEINRLREVLKDMDKKRADGEKIERPEKLSPEIVKQLERIVFREPNQMANELGDNSNTQFVMMALWVARRHGLPVQRALQMVDQRFRHTQLKTSGAWGYFIDLRQFGPNPATGPRMSMSVAGLLALAIGQGNANAKGVKKELLDDEAVKAGLKAINDSLSEEGPNVRPIPPAHPGGEYYFLFSLERMAVVYDLKKIGGRDWYEWGADYLVKQQEASGQWKGKYSDTASDTCFALLFLKRANIAADLTANLQGIIKEKPKVVVPPKFEDKDLFKDIPIFKDPKSPKKQSRLEELPKANQSPAVARGWSAPLSKAPEWWAMATVCNID